jgi:hypothetical protein
MFHRECYCHWKHRRKLNGLLYRGLFSTTVPYKNKAAVPLWSFLEESKLSCRHHFYSGWAAEWRIIAATLSHLGCD